jgi:hypothetical protein
LQKIMALWVYVLSVIVTFGAVDYSKKGANWTGLCVRGSEQSPIDISKAWTAPDRLAPIKVEYSAGGEVGEKFTATKLTGTLSATLLSGAETPATFLADRLRVSYPAEH